LPPSASVSVDYTADPRLRKFFSSALAIPDGFSAYLGWRDIYENDPDFHCDG
jgi:hypothetical protein